MAASQHPRLEAQRVKRQLLQSVSDPSTQYLGHDATQIPAQSSRLSASSGRGPVLGLSGIAIQRRFHTEMKDTTAASCKDCGCSCSGRRRSELPLPSTPQPSMRAQKRPSLTPFTEGLISDAVRRTAAYRAFPAGFLTPQPSRTPKSIKRRLSPLHSDTKRRWRAVKQPRRTPSLLAHEALGASSSTASATLSTDNLTLSTDNLSDMSIDVDGFPVITPKPKRIVPKPTLQQSQKAEQPPSLQDLSRISRTSRTELHEQPSVNVSSFQRPLQGLYGTVGATEYPLHSTMNYPLHSTMAPGPEAKIDLSLFAIPKGEEMQKMEELAKGSDGACWNSCSESSSCSCSECFAEDMEVIMTQKNHHQVITMDSQEGLMSRLPAGNTTSDSQLRRQTGQLMLSQPRSPVQLSETDFLSATVLADASMEVTRDSVPGLDDICENEREMPVIQDGCFVGGMRMTQVFESKACFQTPPVMPGAHHHVLQTPLARPPCVALTPYPDCHLYETITPKSHTHDYENVAKCKSVSKRRRSVHDKENDSPPALPPRQPRMSFTPVRPSSSRPGPHCSSGGQQPYIEMASVLSAHPGCFNLLKKKKKSRGRVEKMGGYDSEKKRILAQKIKHFQRTLSSAGVSGREVTMLGQL